MLKPRFSLVVATGILLLLVLILQATTSLAGQEPPSPAPGWPPETLDALRTRVEPALLKEVLEGESGDQLRFIAELASQVDLSSLPATASRGDSRQQLVAQLQATAVESQADLLALLRARQSVGQVQEVRSLWVINAVAVTGDVDTLLTVAAQPEVSLIRSDRLIRWVEPMDPDLGPAETEPGAVEWNVAHVRADLAWQTLGLDGSGVTVAVVDTGVDWLHPALVERYRGYKAEGVVNHLGNWFCTTDAGALYPVDGNGHGTHVTGTAVGGQDSEGRSIGVAPGARWIAVKTLDDAGYGYDSWIHAAFQWILAPAGDPDLAPDVFNGSWGNADGSEEVFRQDVQALRVAGIIPVFAAGNEGSAVATVASPASYPESIAVGATDDLDVVASFSSRGPSPWGEIKPEVAAPGTSIRSSLPGGIYGTYRGTSMAAPHVAGTAALLLQADSTLSVDGLEAILESTALPLGNTIPNNDTGWGRIDAYRAAAVAMQAGFVTGAVKSQDGTPLPSAQITAYNHEGEVWGTVQSDEAGRYWLALPPGTYDLTAEAFGHAPRTTAGVSIKADVILRLDLILVPLPSGTVQGTVRDAETGAPLAARIWAVDTPAETFSDPTTGRYRLSLPAGTFSIRAALNGYRLWTVPDLLVTAGEAKALDLALVPAPTLLLLDSGGWYYSSKVRYFEEGLDDAGYVYDTWQVRDLAVDVPDLADLAPYEITVWSAPFDSPGLIGAAEVISGYLSSGGKVFLTGQDVGYWDGGLDITGGRKYFPELLKAVAVLDDAGRNELVGLPGELLDGMALTINGPDSAQNQLFPDAIALVDTRDASLVGEYVDVGGAALRCSGCQSYRAVYLAAGLEGLGTRADRAEVLSRSLAWLASPPPATAVQLDPPEQEQVWRGDTTTVTYTVELRNEGARPDRFALELGPSDWRTTLWDAHLDDMPVTESLELSPCQTQTLRLEVEVPAGVTWNTSDVVTLTAHSSNDPAQVAQATFRTKAPAPILLVDDHIWEDFSDRYRAALETNRLPYDYWRAGHSPILGLSSPSLEDLQAYRIVIWFTGYDWYSPLAPSDEVHLAAYLQGGGRLLLSSQDYLLSANSDFAETYLGAANYTESLSSTAVTGAVGSPVGDGMVQRALSYPFKNWSDALKAAPEARPAFWGQHGQPAALSLTSTHWKTAFFAFSMEAFDAGGLAEVMSRTAGWMSPLGDSTMTVDRPGASEGEQLSYDLQIQNTGPLPLLTASLVNPVPLNTTYVPGSLEGPAAYESSANRITWAGALASGAVVTIRYRLQLDSPLPDGTAVTNRAQLRDESGLVVKLAAASRVDAPNLSSSTLTASPSSPTPSQAMTYTFTLHNDGPRAAQASLVDPVPQRAYYQPGSAWASSGAISDTDQAVFWTGSIEPGATVIVRLPVALQPAAAAHYILNRAQLEDGAGGSTTLEAYAWVEARLFLPVLFKRE